MAVAWQDCTRPPASGVQFATRPGLSASPDGAGSWNHPADGFASHRSSPVLPILAKRESRPHATDFAVLIFPTTVSIGHPRRPESRAVPGVPNTWRPNRSGENVKRSRLFAILFASVCIAV